MRVDWEKQLSSPDEINGKTGGQMLSGRSKQVWIEDVQEDEGWVFAREWNGLRIVKIIKGLKIKPDPCIGYSVTEEKKKYEQRVE